jgi:hypothetical protein
MKNKKQKEKSKKFFEEEKIASFNKRSDISAQNLSKFSILK